MYNWLEAGDERDAEEGEEGPATSLTSWRQTNRRQDRPERVVL